MGRRVTVELPEPDLTLLSDEDLVCRLVEAAMTAGEYYDWAQYQSNDRIRYIAAITLVEDAMDELDERLRRRQCEKG